MQMPSQNNGSATVFGKKWCLPELNLDREITTTISKLRTGHMRGMKIMPNGSRTYAKCRYCPGVQLDPRHLFNCISVASTLFNIDLNCCHDTFYTDKVVDVASPDSPWMYQAVAGLEKLSEEDASTVQHLRIAKLFVHEDYNDKKFYNDIALLRTVAPMDISGSKVYSIHLATSNKDPTGTATVTGWGHTMENGENSDTLMEAEVPLISREKCNLAYGQLNPTDEVDTITENMICAGKAGKDSCQNDSGGPLVQKNSKGVSTLIGVVSFGIGCGETDYPGVYTKISKYRKWIKKTMMHNNKK